MGFSELRRRRDALLHKIVRTPGLWEAIEAAPDGQWPKRPKDTPKHVAMIRLAREIEVLIQVREELEAILQGREALRKPRASHREVVRRVASVRKAHGATIGTSERSVYEVIRRWHPELGAGRMTYRRLLAALQVRESSTAPAK